MTDTLLPPDLDFDGPFPRLLRRLRLGIVGGGRIAGTQAVAARLSDRWDVLAGALSSDPGRSRERAAEFHIAPERAYASFGEMAAREAARPDGVDAVMITTPNNLHHAAAVAFPEAGIDVLCDKPLTNAPEEAADLVAQEHSAGIVFGVYYVMSAFPMVRQAREVVAAGALGKINQVHVEFLQDWMTPEGVEAAPHVRLRLDPAVSGPTSCVGDIGTHAAHLARFVSGLTLEKVRAEFHVLGAPKPLEDTAFIFTRHTGGVPGTLLVTRLAHGRRGGLRLRLYGSEGGLEWDMEDCERLRLARFGAPDQVLSRGHGHGIAPNVERLVRTARGFPEGLLEAWANLYTEFALAVAARRDGIALPAGWLELPPLEAGAAGVAFIHAALRSHRGGGTWERIEHGGPDR